MDDKKPIMKSHESIHIVGFIDTHQIPYPPDVGWIMLDGATVDYVGLSEHQVYAPSSHFNRKIQQNDMTELWVPVPHFETNPCWILGHLRHFVPLELGSKRSS